MKLLRSLRRERDGISSVEFALAVPVLLLTLFGMAQIGVLFAANAGLQHAVAEGARFATVYPSPSDTAIQSKVLSKKFFLNTAGLGTPVVARGVSNGTSYVDVSLQYTVPLNFVFFTAAPVTLSQTRRAYLS